jgi:hypothetical protein
VCLDRSSIQIGLCCRLSVTRRKEIRTSVLLWVQVRGFGIHMGQLLRVHFSHTHKCPVVYEEELVLLMMMTFICSCRNNNQPTAIYPYLFLLSFFPLRPLRQECFLPLASSNLEFARL